MNCVGVYKQLMQCDYSIWKTLADTQNELLHMHNAGWVDREWDRVDMHTHTLTTSGCHRLIDERVRRYLRVGDEALCRHSWLLGVHWLLLRVHLLRLLRVHLLRLLRVGWCRRLGVRLTHRCHAVGRRRVSRPHHPHAIVVAVGPNHHMDTDTHTMYSTVTHNTSTAHPIFSSHFKKNTVFKPPISTSAELILHSPPMTGVGVVGVVAGRHSTEQSQYVNLAVHSWSNRVQQ
jgi:hypothetical protein